MDDTTTELPGRKRRRPAGTPKGRQIDPRALEEVRALLGDRPRRRDLLIEYLHLLQDCYGHLSAPASRRARRGDEARAVRNLRGRDVLRPFRRGEGRPSPARDHGTGVRQPVLRHGGGGKAARRSAEDARRRRAGDAGALRRRLRPGAGGGGRPCPGDEGDAGERRRGGRRASARPCLQDPGRPRGLSRGGRLRLAGGLPVRQADPRRRDQDRERRRPARARRRRFPDGTEVVAGARGAGAAPDGGQRRRRRARHLQGPLLPRARSAPLHRGHADRRLGGRGGRHLLLSARRISGNPADAGGGDRQGGGGEARPARPHPHAPRRRRLHLRRRSPR